MKTHLYASLLFILLSYQAIAQKESAQSKNENMLQRQLTIEPAIGIHTNFGTDLLFTSDGFYDAALGVNYVPFNNALISAGFAVK